MYDFVDLKLGKVILYWIYDLIFNIGWVNVGIDYDIVCFVVELICYWWYLMGEEFYWDC